MIIDEKLPEFDIHCPLLSLPFKFSTTLKNIPFNKNIFFQIKNRIIKWKKTFDNQYLNIGINWQASPNPDLDKGNLKYFNETIAGMKRHLLLIQQLENLDLIITCDTSIAHFRCYKKKKKI